MSNAYDSASLLVTPNGYKASKIYSAKPTDGSGDLAFSRASTAMRRNSAGLWEEVANNVPRLQYPVGGGCPSWLFEPQATNLQLESLTFNTYFTTEVTVTAGQTPTVLSGQTSTKLTDNSVNGVHRIFSVSTGSGVCKASIYAKKDTLTEIALVETVAHPIAALFDLNLGTIIANPYGTAQIENAGDGWFRCSIVFTASGSDVVQILLSKGGATSYVGSGESLYIQQNQLETGTVATSPIITAGSAVTRLADIIDPIDVNDFGAANLYTLFFELSSGTNVVDPNSWIYQDSITSTPFQIYGTTCIVITDSGTFYPFNLPATLTSTVKIAITYDGTTVSVFKDGVKINSYIGGSVWQNLKDLYIHFLGKNNIQYKSIILYKAALSDSEALELTTL